MIIRTYTAESVAAALKQVRTEMGGQAVVLKTRLVETGGQKRFEVTACLDKPSVEQANKTLSAEPAMKPVARPKAVATATPSRFDLGDAGPKTAPASIPSGINESRLTAIEAKLDSLLRLGTTPAALDPSVQEIMSQLRSTDMPESMVLALTDEIKTSGAEINSETIHCALVEKLNGLIAPELTLQPGDKVLVLGPAGAGKTSVLGKLAAHLVAEKKIAVRLTSLDNSKIGAIDELESYGALLGMTIDHDATGDSADKSQVLLIDSGSLPVADSDIENLKARINKLAPTCRLAVVSALTRAADMDKMAGRAASLGATHLVVTMTDLTNGWGAVMAAAQSSGLKIVFMSDAPGGSGCLTHPDAETIVTAVMGREAVRE